MPLRTLYLLFRLSRWRPPKGLTYEVTIRPVTGDVLVILSCPGRYAALRINTALSVRRTLEALDLTALAVLANEREEPSPETKQAGDTFEEAMKQWEAK